jgi:DNA polymerase III alpha subunit
MKVTDKSQIVLSEQDILDGLYSGKINDLSNLNIDDKDVVEQFNFARRQNADLFPNLTLFNEVVESLGEFDKRNQEQWFMPKEYEDFPMVEFLLDKTTNEEEYQRVVTELDLYIQHNMMTLLNYLKYLVDTMRSNNIVWGVGRGSSVASYCLYLLGVHKVNSIKYELDIHEFLK